MPARRRLLEGAARAATRRAFESSWAARASCASVRNFHQGFEHGLFAGHAQHRRRRCHRRARPAAARSRCANAPGHERMRKLADAHPERQAAAPIKFDGALTFDKLADVYPSGTSTTRTSRCTWWSPTPASARPAAAQEYGNPCQHFCPAERLRDGAGRGAGPARSSCRSTRRTASTARPATSPIRTRSSPGSRPRAAAARTTRTSERRRALCASAPRPHRARHDLRRDEPSRSSTAARDRRRLAAPRRRSVERQHASPPCTGRSHAARARRCGPSTACSTTRSSDYGDWVLIEPYGYVFRPRVGFDTWHPYWDGFWAPTDVVRLGVDLGRAVRLGDLSLRPLGLRPLPGLGVGARASTGRRRGWRGRPPSNYVGWAPLSPGRADVGDISTGGAVSSTCRPASSGATDLKTHVAERAASVRASAAGAAADRQPRAARRRARSTAARASTGSSSQAGPLRAREGRGPRDAGDARRDPRAATKAEPPPTSRRPPRRPRRRARAARVARRPRRDRAHAASSARCHRSLTRRASDRGRAGARGAAQAKSPHARAREEQRTARHDALTASVT